MIGGQINLKEQVVSVNGYGFMCTFTSQTELLKNVLKPNMTCPL